MTLRDPVSPKGRPRLLLFPGSLRRNSHQRRLLDYVGTIIGDRAAIDLVGPTDIDLPIFNQDLEASPAIFSHVQAVHARFSAAHGIIAASPEYNGHVSPYLKNTVDWVSRLPRIDAHCQERDAFRAKPLLLASASTGWSGGLLGLRDARTLFSYLGCLVGADQICVSDAAHWAATGAFVFEPGFSTFIEQTVIRFLTLVECLAAESPAPCRLEKAPAIV